MSLEGIYGGADTCGVAPFTEAQSLLDASHGELHKSDREMVVRDALPRELGGEE